LAASVVAAPNHDPHVGTSSSVTLHDGTAVVVGGAVVVAGGAVVVADGTVVVVGGAIVVAGVVMLPEVD